MEKEQFEEIGRRLRQIAAELNQLLEEVQRLRNAIVPAQGQKECRPGDEDAKKP